MNKICYALITALVLLSGTAMALDAQGDSGAPHKPTIAVLGTGDMGDSFGPRLAKLGYRIIYGSRSPGSERVTALVDRTGYGASAEKNRDAAEAADVILLAVASRAVEVVIADLGDLEGKIIIDMTWPPVRTADDGYQEIMIATSVAEQIQEWSPKAMVVKAFGSTASSVIDNPDVAGGPVTIPIASDHRHAKEVVAKIAADLSLDPVDAGPLRMAQYIEAMMMLYMIPHNQGRQDGWEFYFRRNNFWACHEYTGGELDENPPPVVDAGNLAEFPQTQGEPEPCP